MALPSQLDARLRKKFLPFCRLKPGQVWVDALRGHRLGCLDATRPPDVSQLIQEDSVQLAIQDPPYNVAALQIREPGDYLKFSRAWVENCVKVLARDAA